MVNCTLYFLLMPISNSSESLDIFLKLFIIKLSGFRFLSCLTLQERESKSPIPPSEFLSCMTGSTDQSNRSPQIVLNICSFQLPITYARKLLPKYVGIFNTQFSEWSVTIFLSLVCSDWNWKGNKNVDQYVVWVQGKSMEQFFFSFFISFS